MNVDSTRKRSASTPVLALSANSAWNILNFRLPLLKSLQTAGYRLTAIIPPGKGVSDLQAAGVSVITLPMSPRGLSPAADAVLLLRYRTILRQLRPSAFLGFTAKPNIYGSLAAAAVGIPAINNITGLGTGFLSGRLLERVMSILYRLALRRSALVLFHNRDDLEMFAERGLVARNRAQVIPGSGIDLDHFTPAPLPAGETGPLTFLFIGRMLIDKGIVEFGEAAKRFKRSDQSSRFVVVGEWAEHPRAAPRALLDAWRNEGVLEFAGSTEDVRPFIAAADCVVLPSYREGLPRSLLEGAAMGRPLIAADVPGCRDVVDNGVTGFLCEGRSSQALFEAMSTIAKLSPEERAEMGHRSRQQAERLYSEERVSNAYVTALARLLA